MFGDLDDLRHRYLLALESYLGGDGEAALEKAYEVGRALIAQGRGVVELADMHAAGTASVLAMSASRGSSSPSVSPAALEAALQAASAAANRFLAEALAPFEMTLRGFEELNRTLEQRVQERTKELEKAQAMFHQAQKMETVGRLAGGVAHDFNNLLSVIMLNADLAKQMPPGGEDMRANLDEILGAGSRASQLTRQLLAFSRKQILSPTVLSLNDVVTGFEAMLRRAAGEKVTIVVRLAPELPRVSADRGQLEQVLMNLVVNARDAMPDGGTITISTSSLPPLPSTAAGSASAQTARVRMSVADTGTGIAPDVVSSIFEPFFTTKSEGHGTGLGLATCYGIAKQSGGAIEVTTALGEGTRFDVTLPALSAAAADASATAAAAAAAQHAPLSSGRKAGVLVVEDEPSIRRATVRALEAGGHVVFHASSGEDALAFMRNPPGPIDLLLTDFAMPGMNGRELAEKLLADRPKLRVLYVSGYSDDEILGASVGSAAVDFLQKPVRPADLLAKVREILARP